MRRLFILFALSLLCVLHIFSQTYLQERRIYLFDVTKSMIGKGNVPSDDIFEDVRHSLLSTISDLEDPNTEVFVVPFTNKIHDIINGNIAHKDSLLKVIGTLAPQSGDTNIADAWSFGVSLLDSTKVNYMFLLTDGLHNEGPNKDEFYKRLRNWDIIRKGKYFFSFYVMLTENATEQEIRDIADSIPQMWRIESMDIKAALIRTSLAQRSNIFEDKTIRVEFISNNSKVFLEDLGVRFSLPENPYYSVTATSQNTLDPNIYEFKVVELTDKLHVPTDMGLQLQISHNKEKYPLVFFTPEEIDFRIINRGVRRMNFNVLEDEKE